MKKLFLLSVFLWLAFAGRSQNKFYTKSGKISFFSSTKLEDIYALNKSSVCLLNTQTGELQFAVLIKGFEFKKALMQEHFNSGDYMNSDKFPKAEFKGQITNNSSVTYTTNGTYTVSVKGKLTIHGVTKDVETSGPLTVKDGKITATSSFSVLLADYNITIPRLYRDNISKSIKITVDCNLDPLK
jgi:hypothetical protein